MKLAELRNLCAKATPGPWSVWPDATRTDRPTLVHGKDENELVVGIQHRQYDDGRFIAAANPELLSALLDVFEAAQDVADVGSDPAIFEEWEKLAALEELTAKVHAAEKLLS